MGVLKLFISHSTKTDENKEILKQICEALDLKNDGYGFKVLVDKEIKPDTEWFPCLYEYMMECHAAVILLSNAALESEWVKAEAAVLCARRRSHKGFKLILVPLDDVSAQQLDNHPFFKAIRLADFQTIQDRGDVEKIITGIGDSLKELKELQSVQTPFDEMTIRIREILTPIKNATPEALERAINLINPEFRLISDDLADSLARVFLRDSQKVFENIKTLFIELSHLINKDQANKILDIVKGYWVHPKAAALLSRARIEQQAVAINSSYVSEFTGDCYARQAWPAPSHYKLVSASSDDRTFEQIEQTLLIAVGRSLPDHVKQRRLYSYNDPLLLVFPFPESNNLSSQATLFPDEFLLDEIKTKLKNVTVILSAGPDVPPQLNYVTTLEPLLIQDQENKQYIDFDKVNEYVNDKL